MLIVAKLLHRIGNSAHIAHWVFSQHSSMAYLLRCFNCLEHLQWDVLQCFQVLVNDNVSTARSALNDENWKMNNDDDDNDIAVCRDAC